MEGSGIVSVVNGPGSEEIVMLGRQRLQKSVMSQNGFDGYGIFQRFNIFHVFAPSYAGAVYFDNASPLIRENVFIDNYSSTGGAVFCNGILAGLLQMHFYRQFSRAGRCSRLLNDRTPLQRMLFYLQYGEIGRSDIRS